MSSSRRSVVKQLLALPWVVALGERVSSASPATQKSPSGVVTPLDHRRSGVQLLRFLNTAELWHMKLTGKYATLPQLRQSEAVARMRVSPLTREPGLDAPYIDALDFDSPHPVPGWTLTLDLANDHQGYSATLLSSIDVEPKHLSTNQDGKIVGPEPPAEAKRGPEARLVKASLFLGAMTSPAPPRDWCWSCWGCCACSDNPCCFPSCNGCNCQPSAVTGLNCTNCGCSCTWVCCVS
jgi:hypothetical protein